MKTRDLNRMRAMVKRLSGWQRKILATELAAMEMAPAAVDVVERRIGGEIGCPDCTSHQIVKNGKAGGLERKPRCRGGGAQKRGLSTEQVPVSVARDCTGATADYVHEHDNSDCVSTLLAPHLSRDTVLCSDSSTVMVAAARKLAIEHHAVNLSAGLRVDGPRHIQNANNYHSRLKGWMRKLKGVASKYLASYLGWFRATDQHPLVVSQPVSFLAMAVGA